MNKHFDINRFRKLFEKELTERIPLILKNCMAVSLSHIGFVLLGVLLSSSPAMSMMSRSSFIMTVSFVVAFMAPFALYKSFNHRKMGIDYITLPASVNEKFLSMILISLVIFPFVIFSTLIVTDTLVAIVRPSLFEYYIFSKESPMTFSISSLADLSVFPLFAFAGNLIFRENKIIKTILSTALIFVIFIAIISILFLYVYDSQLEQIRATTNSVSIQISSLQEMSKMNMFDTYPGLKSVITLLSMVYNIAFPAGALAAAYHKMKTIQY
jgi:hypothetical protein